MSGVEYELQQFNVEEFLQAFSCGPALVFSLAEKLRSYIDRAATSIWSGDEQYTAFTRYSRPAEVFDFVANVLNS